jgi:hypothetical protein
MTTFASFLKPLTNANDKSEDSSSIYSSFPPEQRFIVLNVIQQLKI